MYIYLQVQRASLYNSDNQRNCQYIVQLRYTEEFNIIESIAPHKIHKNQVKSFYVNTHDGESIKLGKQCFKIIFNEKGLSFCKYFKLYPSFSLQFNFRSLKI